MNKKTVKFSLAPSNLPPLTANQQDELTALTRMPDDQIDASDIAPLGESFWTGALRNPFYKPTRQVTTVRIDADVLLWLKSNGKGYQRQPLHWSQWPNPGGGVCERRPHSRGVAGGAPQQMAMPRQHVHPTPLPASNPENATPPAAWHHAQPRN